jgi:hypothetical protein
MIFRSRAERVGRLSGVTPEEVLLQITLGFMVVLGYLLSDVIEEQAPLRARLLMVDTRLAKVEQERDVMREILLPKLKRVKEQYRSWRESPKAKLARERAQAIRGKQESDLHLSWMREKREVPLFRLVAFFELGLMETIPADKLTGDSRFVELRGEVNRLFRGEASAQDANSPLGREIGDLARRCAARVGLELPPGPYDPTKLIDDEEAREAVRNADVQPNVVSWETYQALVDEIRTDFAGARDKVAGIQLDAVKKIGEYMLLKRTAAGRSPSAREVLREVLDEFEAEIGLLEEVRNKLESAR